MLSLFNGDGAMRLREQAPAFPFVHAEWTGLAFSRAKRLNNRFFIVLLGF
jgi:hypothetical protein